jgi:hypothetical protein
MANILDNVPTSLKSLWALEGELRSAAQNALFLRNDEARKHLDEARRHLNEALQSVHPTPPSTDDKSGTRPTVRDNKSSGTG